MNSNVKIIDAHVHFYDHKIHTYKHLDTVDPDFVNLIGNYSSLPRKYLLKDYLQDSQKYQINGIVWHEFMSTDPIKETKWAQDLANKSKISYALVGLVNFLDPNLEHKLEQYKSLPRVTAIREHISLGNTTFNENNSLQHSLLANPKWQKRLNILNQYNFKCGLEVFAHELDDLIKVIKLYPNTKFTIALMGWPKDLSTEGFIWWKQKMYQLSKYDNICVEISAIECIFGMSWTLEKIKPWVEEVIGIFGTNRCMFGSHMPIAKLSRSFSDLYCAYEAITTNLSITEKNDIFHNVAKNWFNL